MADTTAAAPAAAPVEEPKSEDPFPQAVLEAFTNFCAAVAPTTDGEEILNLNGSDKKSDRRDDRDREEAADALRHDEPRDGGGRDARERVREGPADRDGRVGEGRRRG